MTKPTPIKVFTRQNTPAFNAAIFSALAEVGRQYGVTFEQVGNYRWTNTELRLRITGKLTEPATTAVTGPAAMKFPPGLAVTDADIGKTVRFSNGEFRIDGFDPRKRVNGRCVLLTRLSDNRPGFMSTVAQIANMLGRPSVDFRAPSSDALTAEFSSKAPHTTLWLDLEFPANAEPKDLLAALATAGWKEDKNFGGRLPPLGGRQKITVGSPGSDMFKSWTEAERKSKMAAVRAVLRAHGLTSVPHRRLTLADML
jgi:hypothetical protein